VKKYEKGLTLLEVMLAAGIAMVTILGMVHYLNIWMLAQAQQQQERALQLKALKALSVLEYDIKRAGFFASLTGYALHKTKHFAADNVLLHLTCSVFDEASYLRWLYPVSQSHCADSQKNEGIAITYLAAADQDMPYNRQVICEQVQATGEVIFTSVDCKKQEPKWYVVHSRYFIRHQGQPKLYVQWLSSRLLYHHRRPHLNTQVKVEGVERLIVLYGLGRQQGDRFQIETYQTLDQIQTSLWHHQTELRLVALQIQVVVRSEKKAIDTSLVQQHIPLIDGRLWQPKDDYVRLSMTRLITLHHMLH
tara:strand:+ start:2203 stop:3120 length:918 start_codon:yes stop_codon:yes gene_type:complete